MNDEMQERNEQLAEELKSVKPTSGSLRIRKENNSTAR